MFWAIILILLVVITALALAVGSPARQRLQDAMTRLLGGVPWIHAYRASDLFFVSRHALAEGGLECPFCRTTYPSGDFSRVYQLRIDGRPNEVVKCIGRRIVEDGREVDCGSLLAASPDTEHGDHLNDDGTVDHLGVHDPDEFYVFRRAPADQYLREKWGMETRDGGDGKVDVPDDNPKNRTTEKLPAAKAEET